MIVFDDFLGLGNGAISLVLAWARCGMAVSLGS